MDDPGLRTAILLGGLVFCVAFGALTISVMVKEGFDILTATSLLVLTMIGIGMAGALWHRDE
jgi:hypothetical protein